MEYKGLPANLSLKDISGRTVTGIPAVMGNIDSGNDRIFKNAFKKSLQEGTGRVKHLWQHDGMNPPVAVIKSLKEIGAGDLPEAVIKRYPEATGGLEVVREYLDTQKGNEILEGIRAGAINEMSFAYDAVKFDFAEEDTDTGRVMVRNLKELRLWDTSDVNWGMNAATVAVKFALPYRDNGIDTDNSKWIEPKIEDFTDLEFAELKEADLRRIAAHYAYASNNPVTEFTDLALAHHKPGKSGVGVAVFKGVVSAMAALADGAVPDKEVEAVYTHLSKHYEQFGETAPDLKFINLSRAAKAVTAAGLKIVGLEPICGSLKGLIAEPLAEAKTSQALTNDILLKIAIAERQLFQ